MIINPVIPMRNLATTNRFVSYSPQYWRAELHPRFSDIFKPSDFTDIALSVNNTLSFPFDNSYISTMAQKLFEHFSGYRFISIPSQVPDSPRQFLAFLYFILSDFLPQLQFKLWKITPNDFGVMQMRAEAEAGRTTKGEFKENLTSDTETNTNSENNTNIKNRTQNQTETELQDDTTAKNINKTENEIYNRNNARIHNDIATTSETDTSSSNTNSVEIEDESNQADRNNKTVQNVFLSPQNQGVTPVTANTKGDGVDGITVPSGAAYTTNATHNLSGDTNISKRDNITNTLENLSTITENFAGTQRATAETTTDDDIRAKTDMEAENEIYQKNRAMQTQTAENQTDERNTISVAAKSGDKKEDTHTLSAQADNNDRYGETLDFNRAARLQNFYDLEGERLFFDIIELLSTWVLKSSIARTWDNFAEYPEYS